MLGVTASANGSSAASGNYAVTVQALARNQNVVSNATLANGSELVGAGTLVVDVGAWDVAGTTLTPPAGSNPVQIDVLPGDTLQSLRDKINASGAPAPLALTTRTARGWPCAPREWPGERVPGQRHRRPTATPPTRPGCRASPTTRVREPPRWR